MTRTSAAYNQWGSPLGCWEGHITGK